MTYIQSPQQQQYERQQTSTPLSTPWNSKKKLIIGVIAIMVIAVIVLVIIFSNNDNNSLPSKGFFSLGFTEPTQQIWTSSTPKHIIVTIEVTSSQANSHSQTSTASVTVVSDNKELKLYVGDNQTLEDTSATFVSLGGNPAYNEFNLAYYGIEGFWEVKVLN